jgi:hypothetical protein
MIGELCGDCSLAVRDMQSRSRYVVSVVFQSSREEATMARESKIFRPADVPESNASCYPVPFREGQRKRYNRRLSDHAGLKNYGVNLARVLPGGQSSARHAHSKQESSST